MHSATKLAAYNNTFASIIFKNVVSTSKKKHTTVYCLYTGKWFSDVDGNNHFSCYLCRVL